MLAVFGRSGVLRRRGGPRGDFVVRAQAFAVLPVRGNRECGAAEQGVCGGGVIQPRRALWF
jgi:hypothetical protein